MSKTEVGETSPDDVWARMKAWADSAGYVPLLSIVAQPHGDGSITLRLMARADLPDKEAEDVLADVLGNLRSQRIGKRILKHADDMPPKKGEAQG
jgi:hypothetical protein